MPMNKDRQRTIWGVAITVLFFSAVGVGLYFKHLDDQQKAAEAEKMWIAHCDEVIRRTNKYSLVLTDERVRTGLACSEDYPQFKWFKKLFDERSPNSPTRKPDN
ncbi:CHASE3 domain-containing protein [Brucella anthropi]|jgi:hypothetical protein|uniref:CHASE3 domain-containing protein n=1 Tax=Brucella anthropi TaxID=529 RepID=UPI0021663ECE|nr:hypothetical protein [Brucella anthropi]UVV66520.1 hypothetical protein NW321_08475 [Brucella anthropi]